VGVTKSLKTDSRPLERKPSVPLKDLLYSVLMGAKDEDTLTSLANRLARLSRELNEDEQRRIAEKSGGKPLNDIVHVLLDAVDPDQHEAEARRIHNLKPYDTPTEAQLKQAANELVKNASGVFNGELNTLIESIRRSHEQIIDTVNLDKLEFAGWDKQSQDKASGIVQGFSAFLQKHKDEIIALSIFYNQPYRRKEVTYRMIREVLDLLKQENPDYAPFRVWAAYDQLEHTKTKAPQNELTALVSLIRRVCDIDKQLTPYDQTVHRNFQSWILQRHQGNAPKFNEEQMEWLRMIRDHIANSVHMERDDLERAPFDSRGGLGRMWQLFGEGMDGLLEEMNEVLVA
jgi:type I restriction enzyme R subunit